MALPGGTSVLTVNAHTILNICFLSTGSEMHRDDIITFIYRLTKIHPDNGTLLTENFLVIFPLKHLFLEIVPFDAG